MLKKNLDDYRKGAVGALMDEYERAAIELKLIVQNTAKKDYEQIADSETTNEDCRSIQTIVSHVIFSGYGYADAIREDFSMKAAPREKKQISHQEFGIEIDKMLAYTVETLEGNWELSVAEMNTIIIKSDDGFIETIEQLLEHAIVHVLRHRRQIENFLLKFEG